MNEQKENGLIWTRTILECYNRFPRMTRSLEKAGEALVRAGLGGGHFALGYTTEELFEKMIDLNYRKTGIINLKVLLEQSLRRISPALANVLKAKFILKLDTSIIAEKENVSTRTVFRRTQRGLLSLYEVFVSLGFDDETLDREYKNEPLLLKEKARVMKKVERESDSYSKSS